MEFIRSIKSRSILSESAYIFLNIALAVGIFALVLGVNNIWLPLILVLISKWRVLAVRMRYWWINIISNMVDLIVSTSYVILLYSATGSLVLQVVMLLLFIVWLLVVKPSSSKLMVGVQALTAVFVGTTSLAMTTYSVDVMIFVVGMWLIGYLAARHFLTAHELAEAKLLCLSWGLILAETGWIGFHWLFTYTVADTASFKLVQLSLIATLLSFLAGRAVELAVSDKKFKFKELTFPALFSFGLILVLVFVFDNINVVGSI